MIKQFLSFHVWSTVIQQPITLPSLPQVPLALHQAIIQQPRQYIHIKTEPNVTAAASNIPAQLHTKNNTTFRSNVPISQGTSSSIKNIERSDQTTPTNIKIENDHSQDDQCDNSSNSSSSISPCSNSSITGNECTY